jgi:hypothetical protein
MFKDEQQIQYHGFHPSEFIESLINTKMTELLDEAPYGATLKATFTRKENEFKGVVTIYSSAGRFFAAATENNIKEVCQMLVGQMRKKLSKWKTFRFQQEIRITKKEENHDSDASA